MPDITPTFTRPGNADGSIIKAEWTLAGTAAGSAIGFAEWADRSVQMAGTWGGGSVTFEGSNDGGATWFPLTDAQGLAIVKTSNSLESIVEITELARPRATTAVTSVVVSLLARRQSR